jgi:hypothetical protein
MDLVIYCIAYKRLASNFMQFWCIQSAVGVDSGRSSHGSRWMACDSTFLIRTGSHESLIEEGKHAVNGIEHLIGRECSSVIMENVIR